MIVALAFAALGAAQPPPAPAPQGEYWLQPPRCLDYRASAASDAPTLRWCVSRIQIVGDRMTLYISREMIGYSQYELKYNSDEGNRNMYLRDDAGRRYDTIAVDGIGRGGAVSPVTKRVTGAYTFPSPDTGGRSFVFYDDDAHVRLEGLRIDPTTLVDAAARQEIQEVLAAADRIQVRDAWSGLTLAPSPVAAHSLRKGADGWTGEISFSVGGRTQTMPWAPDARTMTELFEALAPTLVSAAAYVPNVTHRGDRPSLRLEIAAGSRQVAFHTESHGVDHLPWAADIRGRTYSVPTAAPAHALARLLRSVKPDEAQRLIDALLRGRDAPARK